MFLIDRFFFGIFFMLLLMIYFSKCNEGIVIYNPNLNSMNNGFGYYTEKLELKNISKGYAQNGASLRGISAVKINNEVLVFAYGKMSLIKNQKLGGFDKIHKKILTKYHFQQ